MTHVITIPTHWQWREKRMNKECFSPMGTTRPRISGKRLYSSPKYAAYMRHLFEEALRYEYPEPEEIDHLSVCFYFPMPKSWSQKKQLLMQDTPHRAKPDGDNCIKAVQDALWINDERLGSVSYEKRWTQSPVGYVRITIDAR